MDNAKKFMNIAKTILVITAIFVTILMIKDLKDNDKFDLIEYMINYGCILCGYWCLRVSNE